MMLSLTTHDVSRQQQGQPFAHVRMVSPPFMPEPDVLYSRCG